MPLKKATQAVIAPNICTTDTDQTITGIKTFSNSVICNVTGNVVGNVTGNVTGDVTGNSSSATILQNSRTIQVAGAVMGATGFNGSENISINTTIASGTTIASPAFSGIATGATGAQIPSSLIFGSITGASGASGYVGEVISSSIAVANAVSLTSQTQPSSTATAVTSISLPPGEWLITGQVAFRAAATTSITVLKRGIGTSATALGSQDTYATSFSAAFVPTASVDVALPIPTQSIITTTSPSTPIYLLAQATFTVATLSAFGNIQARRIR